MNDKGEMIGTFGLCRGTEKLVEIQGTSESLMNSLEETNEIVNEIACGSQKLSEQLGGIIKKTKQAEENVRESSEVTKLIQNISRQSNLLGLNASIEAARAGEYGRGFSVVASEMRKLAQISSESSQKISATLIEMSNSIKSISSLIEELGGIATQQTAAVEAVSSTIHEITSNSQVLVNNINKNS